MQKLAILAAVVVCLACGDKLTGVPNAGSLASVPATYSVAAVRDSVAPPSVIVADGDSVRFTAVTAPVCGRDTLIAGVARDSVVVTLVQTALPLPCALINGKIRFDGVVRGLTTRPRAAVLTLADVNGLHTERSILAVARRQ